MSSGSGFTGYGQSGNGANEKFSNYGNDQNNPANNFQSYGDGGNAGVETFTSYRESANVGDDSFQSYAKNFNDKKMDFTSYGKSFNIGSDMFTEYGKGAKGQDIGFKIYDVNTTFKDYAKKETVSFKSYTNAGGGSWQFGEKMGGAGQILPGVNAQERSRGANAQHSR
ncbi:hypothetical protein ACFX1S_026792 [Malus domestica]